MSYLINLGEKTAFKPQNTKKQKHIKAFLYLNIIIKLELKVFKSLAHTHIARKW